MWLFADWKTQDLVLIEYLVRWSGYDFKRGSLVLRKHSISAVAVREFKSDRRNFGKDTPGQILARIPVGLHRSHVAYKSAQEIASSSCGRRCISPSQAGSSPRQKSQIA